MIGIIVADPNEMLNGELQLKKTKVINQYKYYLYSINDKEVVLVNSGIGIANAAASTQALIENFDIDTIWNYGAVGASGSLNVYDIVTPKEIKYHDVNTPWYQRGQTPGEESSYKNSFLLNNQSNLASGSSFISSVEYASGVNKELDSFIFDMETAAIAQIASKNNVPLNVVKVVSDNIGNDQDVVEDINERIANAGKIAYNQMIKAI